MSSCSNNTSSPYKNRVESMVVGSRPTDVVTYKKKKINNILKQIDVSYVNI